MHEQFSHGYSWDAARYPGVTLSAAVEYRLPRNWCQRVCHPYWALDMSWGDAGLYRIGSSRTPWQLREAGVAHLYPPGTIYWEDYRSLGRPVHAAYICFQHGEMAGLARFQGNPLHYARFTDQTGRLAELLHRSAEVGRQYGESGFWRAQSLFCLILDLLLDAETREGLTWNIRGSKSGPREDPFVLGVQAYLEAHLERKVLLAELAEQVHTSISTLSHRYQALTGETPLRTHMRLRMNRAKQLLVVGTPLKSIAEQLGFTDIQHLSNSFKRVNGVSPRAYLRTPAPTIADAEGELLP